jgi:hypothetical protein
VSELTDKLTAKEQEQISEALDIMTEAARDLEAEPIQYSAQHPQTIHN